MVWNINFEGFSISQGEKVMIVWMDQSLMTIH